MMLSLLATVALFASSANFVPVDAGEWRAFDSKKANLHGARLTAMELKKEPVVIMQFDPAEKVSAEDRKLNKDGRFFVTPFDELSVPMPRFMFVNVPKRSLTGEEMGKIAKLDRETAALAGWPWYDGLGLDKEPVNESGKYPFYYVVSTEGKVVYAGNSGADAFVALQSDLAQLGKGDPLLGYLQIRHHQAIADTLKFGESVVKQKQKLKPLAAKGEEDAKAEAAAILTALAQSETYWEIATGKLYDANPLLAAALAQGATRSFPQAKLRYKGVLTKANSNPLIAKAAKTYAQLMAYQEKLPEKKSDLIKAYKTVLDTEALCAKAKAAMGERLPGSFQELEGMVQSLKGTIEATGVIPKKK